MRNHLWSKSSFSVYDIGQNAFLYRVRIYFKNMLDNYNGRRYNVYIMATDITETDISVIDKQ